MNRILLSAVLATYAGAAAAQELNGAIPAELKTGATPNTRLQGALETARTAMNDGVEVGGVVVAELERARINVVFASQPEASKTLNGGAVISLSDALPAYPRPIALAVAREVAKRLVAEQTPSSESEYIKASVAARAWIELGGECSKLPVVEPITGEKNDELSSSISIWCANRAEMALYKIGEATKTKSLMVLREEAKTDAERSKLDFENRAFVQFVIAENDWRRMH